MAATKTKKTEPAKPAPSVTSLSSEERIPATRYRQGGRTVFSLVLSPDELVAIMPRPNPEASNPGNRKIRPKHAADFAQYYLDNEKWVIPSLILRAPSIFSFQADMEAGDGSAQYGVLSYSKRSQLEIQILDGQHRILGFHIALDQIVNRIEKAKDFRARALRTEGGNTNSAAVREAEAALAAAEKLRDRFFRERVSVDVHVTDDITEYRQMFYDIAENQIGITAAVKSRFDSTKVANRALALVTDHPLLQNRMDIDNDRIGPKSPFLVSAKHVTEIIRSAQVGASGRIGKVVERNLNDLDVANNTNTFLDLLVDTFPQYKALIAGQLTAETLRSTSLLGSPATIRMLASVYHDLKSEKHQWSTTQIGEYFKTLAPHMNDRAHANSIWIADMPKTDKKGSPITPFYVDAYGPDVRRQNIAGAVDALVDWAILGKKGAPFVWADPKPAPEPEATDDELALQAEIEADPDLVQLIADRDRLEAEMASQGKIKK